MSVRVHLCGRLQVEWDGERLEGALPGRQGRTLFAFLALHRERLVRRDELVAALWSEDGSPPGGDELLRPPLSRLRSALGAGRLEGRGELAITFPQDTWVDFEAVREGLRRGRALYAAGDAYGSWEAAREALAITRNELLPGLDAPWLEPFRGELQEHRLQLLETVARAGAGLGDSELSEAEAAARAAVEAAPFRESARAALLEVLRRRGNVAEALVAFDQFRVLLREELGASPGRELLSLHADLLRAGDTPRSNPPSHVVSGLAEHRRLPDRLAQALATPWVGREAALDRLRGLAHQAAAGHSSLALIGGDGGIGKTRLVAELAAGLPGFDVLYGRCDEEETFPYGPWIDLLRPRLGAMGGTELAAVVGGGASDLVRLLPELRQQLPSDGAPVPADPETERRLLFLTVARVVTRLARRRPLLLVLDDLHWADRSSLLLTRHVARELQLGRVLLVGTFRDTELGPGHPLPDMITDVERDRSVSRLRLGGMDDREIGELIEAWHGTDVRHDTVQAIRSETDGNPFFVKQLVRHLEEATGDVAWVAGDTLGIPAGVQEVITRRVARLPEPAGQVLRVAALIGRDFELELLEQVSDIGADTLLDLLDAAVGGALLVEVPSAPGRYSFAHALLRSTMEATVSLTRRAVLHRRIGEAIEKSYPDRLDDLARHFAEAGRGQVDRAVDYAVRAAGQATDRLAHDDAVQLLERAVALRHHQNPVDQLEVARLQTALGTAQAGAGRWEVSRGTFARAAESARAVASNVDAAEPGALFAHAALGHSGSFWEQYGRYDAASIALLEEALSRLPAGDSRLRSQVLARLAVLLYWAPSASWEQQRDIADTAVDIARRLADDDALVAALAAAQHARWRPGPQDDRLSIIDELIELSETRGAFVEAAVAHLCRAGVSLERCALDDAETDIERAEQIIERVQQYQLLIFRDGVRATRALLAGDYRAGAAAAEKVLDWGRRTQQYDSAPMPMLLQTYAIEQMELLNERDELDTLSPLAKQLVAEVGELPGWRAVLAWADVQADRTEPARSALEAISAERFAAVPLDVNFVPTLALFAHAAAELGDAALAARAEPVLAPYRDRWVVFGIGTATLGPVAYSLGLLQLLQDRPEDAAHTFESAVERSIRMRARPYVARSRAGLAKSLLQRAQPGDAARATKLFALAAAEARELGMTRLLREIGTVHH